MPYEEETHLREMLLKHRKDVFDRLHQFESDWQALGEREPEIEEEAQKADMTSVFDRLDERSKDLIEAIDLALCKMVSGSYGICEECEELIDPKRLDAIPEARLCFGCARKYEKKQKRLPHPRELMPCSALPDEYRNLSDEELVSLAVEHLRADKRVDLQELEISSRRGVLYLEGRLPDEGEHQIILQILTDIMGLTSVVDLLGSDELAWERTDRSPGKVAQAPPLADGGLAIESVDYTEDVFESTEEGIPYTPPVGPIREEE